MNENPASLVPVADTLGQSGKKAMMAFYDGDVDTDLYAKDFVTAYNAGLNGKPRPTENYVSAGKAVAAYTAGQNDAAASLGREKRAAQFAKVAGAESGLVYDDYVDGALDTATADRVNSVAKLLGTRVRFVDSVRGGTANAEISGSDVLVEKGNANPVMYLLGHEWTHRLQETAPEQYRAFRNVVAQEVQGEAQVLMEQYRNAGEEINFEGALDEATANYAGMLLEDGKILDSFIQKHQQDRTLLEKVRDAIKALVQKLTGAERRQAQTAAGKLTAALEASARQVEKLTAQKNTAQAGGAKYSINHGFQDDIRVWDKAGQTEGETFTLGTTGPVLQGLGAIESDIYMNGDKISKILKDHTEMTVNEIQRIPEILEDPVLIMKSKGTNLRGNNSRLVVFGSVKAQNGQPVMTVLDLVPRENGFLLDDMQKVNSAYTKNNPAGFIMGSDVLHADKKRTIPLLRSIGLTIASRPLLRHGSIGSISYSGANVNLAGAEFSTVVDLGKNGEKRFSLKAPVEETRDLLALHNMTEKNLRDALELGGLPAPSIAIVQARGGPGQGGPVTKSTAPSPLCFPSPQSTRARAAQTGFTAETPTRQPPPELTVFWTAMWFAASPRTSTTWHRKRLTACLRARRLPSSTLTTATPARRRMTYLMIWSETTA